MEEKIEAVARALCTQDGRDPNQRTRSVGGRVGFQANVGEVPDGPLLWEAYRAEAEKFIAASEALQPFIQRERRW